MEAVLSAPHNRVQGFLAAGRVCTVMGYTEYEPLASNYRVPIVVSRLMHQLLEKVFLPAFDNPFLAARHDGAVLDVHGVGLAFTTDSYVVRTLFFPGGDIGSLAINGTVNDLAMCG